MGNVIVIICVLVYVLIGGIIFGLLKDSECGEVGAASIAYFWGVLLLGLPIIVLAFLGNWLGKKLKKQLKDK